MRIVSENSPRWRAAATSVIVRIESARGAPAASKLALQLAQVRFADPSPPVVTNVEASSCADGGRLAGLLEQQVTAPVRFTEMVEYMAGQGVDRVLEVGPGRVLAGLVARIDRKVGRANLSSLESLDEAVAFVNQGA